MLDSVSRRFGDGSFADSLDGGLNGDLRAGEGTGPTERRLMLK